MIRNKYPVRIVGENNVENSKNLLIKKTIQIGLNEKIVTVFNPNSYIVIDFGVELRGSLELLTFKNENAKVRIRYGESVSETFSDVGGYKNAKNDHSVRDFEVVPPDYSDQIYTSSGFRFVRIDVTNGSLTIKSVIVKSEEFSKKPIYEYTGSDSKIKEIFSVAKRTVSLCSAGEYIWDGIKRDRLVWYGDLHPEMIALTTIYGRTRQVENSIDLARKEYPLPEWMNFFPSYSMWWAICVSDYYFLTNCEKFIKKQLKYLNDLVSQFNEFVDNDGEMYYPDYFVDWPTYMTDNAIAGVRAINIIACNKVKKLFKQFNISTTVCEELLNKLLKKEIISDNKVIIALKCLAFDKTTKEDYDKLIQDGSKGFSTFMSYYLLKAIAMYNKDKALELMKEYFGKMLSLGATTFWEDFNIDWADNEYPIDSLPVSGKKDIHGDFGDYCYRGFRHSLCHGWSTGIIYLIKEYANNK